MRLLLIIICLSVGLTLNAQYAIIQDDDGYTNVRNAPTANAEIITRIYDNEIFSYIDDGKSQWIEVFIPVDKFTVSCSEIDYAEGYIHKSRLKDVKHLPRYDEGDITMQILTSDFNKEEHHIELIEGEFVVSIDGRPVWGRDGSLPLKGVDNIVFNIQNKEIKVPEVLLLDLYELSDQFKVYQKEDTYFFRQENGDGAGYYEVIWVVGNGKILQRFITTL